MFSKNIAYLEGLGFTFLSRLNHISGSGFYRLDSIDHKLTINCYEDLSYATIYKYGTRKMIDKAEGLEAVKLLIQRYTDTV